MFVTHKKLTLEDLAFKPAAIVQTPKKEGFICSESLKHRLIGYDTQLFKGCFYFYNQDVTKALGDCALYEGD